MAAITAGQSGSFFLTATASDNSTVSLASPTLTADDTTVTIAPDTTDPSGLTFTVTVPASDTATTFNLSATAQASSNTSTAPQSVTATLAVTISPARFLSPLPWLSTRSNQVRGGRSSRKRLPARNIAPKEAMIDEAQIAAFFSVPELSESQKTAYREVVEAAGVFAVRSTRTCLTGKTRRK